MELKLSSLVTDLPRIGPSRAKVLKKLNITHVRDFLFNFPRKHDDFSTITPIGELKAGEVKTIHGRIASVKTSWGFRGRRRLFRIFVDLADDTGSLSVTWYNLQFLPKQLWQGREIFVAGEVEENNYKSRKTNTEIAAEPVFRMRSPVIEFPEEGKEGTHTGRITPVYSETSGVTSRFLRYMVKYLLPLIKLVPEYLPTEIISHNHLIGIHEALTNIHFPVDSASLARAEERLKFDELFFLQLAALVRRRQRKQRKAYGIKSDAKIEKKFYLTLPFELTGAQKVAMQEITADMTKGVPMNRLLQGDVGSGKSIVALYGAHLALEAGFTVVYLAPTEILARQQAKHFAEILGKDKVALLISAIKPHEKREIKRRLASQEALCVIGTHALLQDDVGITRCALAIVDEQHRFGVEQRQALLSRAIGEYVPHLLSMTATPIPRTLNLTVYGDLDISILNELPPGRQPIITKVVALGERDEAIIHILKELHAGRQAYVIAPLVEESEKSELKSVKTVAQEMKKLFPDIAVGLLHGQMLSEEKEQVIRNFAAGALQLLVATAIVEVGINVPNATIMIIEGAERFGLAQLHQFRGRIGRGQVQSYCYLFPTEGDGASSRRLRILERTTDGFVIAEEDLKMRGPGEMYGVSQSGFGNLHVATLLDYAAIKKTRAEAEKILADDPDLKRYPILRKKVEQKNLITHFE